MFKNKIFKQLSLTFFVVIALSLSVFAIFMLDTFNEHTMRGINEHIIQTSKNIQFALAGNYPQALYPSEKLTEYIRNISRLNKVSVYVLDAQQSLVVTSEENSYSMLLPEDYDTIWYDASKVRVYTRNSLSENEKYIFAMTQLNLDSANYILVISAKMQDLSANLTNIRNLTFAGLVIATFLALLISVQAARNFTKPIVQLIDAAGKYAQGELKQKIVFKSNDEFAELAYALNNVGNKLSDKIKEIDMEKRKLALILEQMDNAVMLIDRAGIIQTLNRQAMDIFSPDRENKVNMHSIEVLGSAYFESNLRKTIITNTSFTIDLKLCINDTPKNFQVFLTPISEAYSNVPKYVLCVFYDVTALMNIYDKQVEFVANASHELRTPLTSIRGFAETIEDVVENPELVVKFSQVIQDESLRMQRLIADLLQLAKLDSLEYRNSILLTPTNMEKLLPSICLEMKQQTLEKNIELKYLDKVVHNHMLTTNYDWLKQALVNLVENAIKYTPHGGKIILVAERDEDGYRFVVQDNGPGMPEHEQKKIFERFYRLDRDRNRSTGGTGLGLSIVRFIIQILGASIKVDSTIGVGSTFTINIPLDDRKNKNNQVKHNMY